MFLSCLFVLDMSTTAFIEPLPVIDFVAQILGKDVYSRPMSDADRVKVLYCVAHDGFPPCNAYKHVIVGILENYK